MNNKKYENIIKELLHKQIINKASELCEPPLIWIKTPFEEWWFEEGQYISLHSSKTTDGSEHKKIAEIAYNAALKNNKKK